MKRSRLTWYLLAALLALVPVGVRVLTWKISWSQPVDPAMAQAGEELFNHEWKPEDPLAPDGDGLGPVFNATSCVACHQRGGPGGSGGLESNVTIFTVRNNDGTTRQGVVHARAVRYQETLRHVHPELPAIARPALALLVPLPGREREAIPFPPGVHVSQRNTPALFGAKLIDDLPARVLLAQEKGQRLRWGLAPPESEHLPVGRAPRLTDGRVGKFGWKGQAASLADFVQAACANELGLGNPGHAQPAPLGKPDCRSPGLDLTLEQCDQLTAFVASLPRSVERPPETSRAREDALAGKRLFHAVGCADCHTPDLGPVEGIYSDLLLHRMGQELQGGGSYNGRPVPVPDAEPGEGPLPSEWRTPPLWGVADSAPYLHDGRAATLEEAIRMHGGQGTRSARQFAALNIAAKAQLIAFLTTMRAP
ncbi:MAG: c-type cytochrome [Planctomycetes bacterium]|nr:c-type cytochrome [Planctomycetota bacterium]